MICEHLRPLELEMIAAGIKETFRGKPTKGLYREWVYYDCVFTNPESTRLRFSMRTDIIKIHSFPGTENESELGLICTACLDGLMGKHPDQQTASVPLATFE